MKYLMILVMLLPTTVRGAEELVARYGDNLRQCYATAENQDQRSQCIGELSSPCMATENGGETTIGMSECLYSEYELWDVFLNQEYRKTMAWAKQMDADDAEYFPEFANRAKTLLAAQRAWITFRDAECAFEYAIFGSGTMRSIVGAGCIMQQTAERTIELLEKRNF